MKTNWINTEDKLPPFDELVWLWDGEDYITLGERAFIATEGSESAYWLFSRLGGEIYIKDGKITAECEFDDLDIKYWHEVPQLNLKNEENKLQ